MRGLVFVAIDAVFALLQTLASLRFWWTSKPQSRPRELSGGGRLAHLAIVFAEPRCPIRMGQVTEIIEWWVI